jgi:hypothetical protein
LDGFAMASDLRTTSPSASIRLGLLLAAATLAGGCVEREMTIRSDPPGAEVYVDDNEIGATPISTPFIYYGQRNIRLVKDGYETKSVIQTVNPPWYQIPPLDFVTENLLPGKLRDQRTYDYHLDPQAVVPQDQLLGRAEELRRGTAAAASASALGVPEVRVNPPAGPPLLPGAAPPVGGQPLYPLPPSAPGVGPPTSL